MGLGWDIQAGVKVWHLAALVLAIWFLVSPKWRVGLFCVLVLLVAVGVGPV